MEVVLSGSLFPMEKCTWLQKLFRYHSMVTVNNTQLLTFFWPWNIYLTYFLKYARYFWETRCSFITTLIISFRTLSGLMRVWDALSQKLNWLLSFGSFLLVLEASLSGRSSSPPSSTSSSSVVGVSWTGIVFSPNDLCQQNLQWNGEIYLSFCFFLITLCSSFNYCNIWIR